MKNILFRTTMLLLFAVSYTMQAKSITVIDTIFDRKAYEEKFAFGADIGFVSQMESWNTRWYDKNGAARDILYILKSQGINNVRLRVWVNPSGGWCGKKDVVNMAKRADKLGMGIMLCFHYSDTWADPGTQDRPAAWKDYSVAELEKAVYNHTQDIINGLKAEGITPRWAQIGNETKRGMFYPTAQTNKGGTDNFAKILKAGIKAVKDIDTSIKTIVHLPDGHDNSLYRSMFDNLKNRGVKWDLIGMSAYPRWSHLDGPTMIQKVMYNVNDMNKRYNTPVMVVETGHYWDKPIEANNYLVQLMDTLIKKGQPGVSYWEPESLEGYDLGAWDRATKRPTAAMDAFLGLMHSEVPWVIKANLTAPCDNQVIKAGAALEAAVDAQHIRNRKLTVDFFVDGRSVGKQDSAPYVLSTNNIEIGTHKMWAKISDAANYSVCTDTVVFDYGESFLIDDVSIDNGTQRGGTATWMLDFKQPGWYKFVVGYKSSSFLSAEGKLGTDSIVKVYFPANSSSVGISARVPEAGIRKVVLTSTSSKGLPDIHSLRVFPLDGQALPAESSANGIEDLCTDYKDETLDVYSMSGVFLYSAKASQLGVSLGSKPSAVVFLPNCVGETPNIVRKHRLK